MHEFLIFSVAYLAGIASVKIWENMSKNKKASPDDITNDYATPIELEDGKFAIPKPADEFMEGVEFDEIRTDPKFKVNAEAERIKNPNGTPTGNPR